MVTARTRRHPRSRGNHEHQALPLADGRGLPATILVAAILALGVSHPAAPPLRAASDLTKDPKRNVATDFRIDCKTCNIPANKDDCVYVRGCPVLKKPTPPK